MTVSVPPLAHRFTDITGGGSDGWEVFLRARSMIAQGIKVTELTIGEHDIRTSPAILDAMHTAAKAGHTGYASIPGVWPLRSAIAARMSQRLGAEVHQKNIIVTPGGQAALFASHLAACGDGDRALFIDPYYATYPGTIRAIGAVPVAVQARAENGFLPTAADIDAAASQGARSLLINTPNNPTGVVYPRRTLEEIAEVVKGRNLWLISDEVYDTQVWDGDHLSPAALPGMAERTLVVGSMSKSHAMTGSRIGWICGPQEVIDGLVTLSTHTTYGVPGFIQDAATFALNQGSAIEDDIAAPFRRRRDIALDLLAGQNVVRAVPPQGAMYTMLDIRATGLSGEAFANRLLDEEHIAVMPGESFGKAAAGHIRVAMTIPDDAFRTAFARLLGFAAKLSS